MKKATTTSKIKIALNNEMLKVTKTEIYYKTLGTIETINTSLFCDSFDFLCESGIFADAIGWHYERDIKTDDYIIETGRKNPDTEVIITVYLRVSDNSKVEDIDRTLLFEQ